MRKLVAIIVLILALAVTSLGDIGTKTAQARIPANQQAWQYKWEVWLPEHWQNLGRCEGHLNWKHHHYYEGTFGFDPGSWDDYKYAGYPDAAYLATPWQQWRVGLRIAAKLGMAEPWGCWRGSQHAWVRNGLPEYGTYK